MADKGRYAAVRSSISRLTSAKAYGIACRARLAARSRRSFSIVPLPTKCPELNPVENVWQFMRQNWLSNRIFQSDEAIVDHCCEAWNKLVDQPARIKGAVRADARQGGWSGRNCPHCGSYVTIRRGPRWL
jgi:transposase